MSRRNWKRLRPATLRDALKACKDFAQERHNLGIERIAARMGLEDHWVLYKWLASARMPAVMIPAYENACGCHYVTQWLAGSAGQLMIDVPTGRTCGAQDLQDLQALLHAATGALMAFYAGGSDTPSTLAAIRSAMEGLGWHHGNVAQHDQPQLELGEEEHE